MKLAVKLEDYILELLDAYAEENGMTRSQALRVALKGEIPLISEGGGKKNKIAIFYVTKDLLDYIDKLAEENGVTRSEVVRNAILKLVNEYNNRIIHRARVGKLTL
jgi:metal-responsive CopG/Arc/MetJ family transcriptional regulator